MDKNKIIATVVGLLLLVGGFFLKADLKGMVCGSAPVEQTQQ